LANTNTQHNIWRQNRMKLSKLLLSATLAFAATGAFAQAYPNKPIRWVVPYTPGGFTDNVTRMVTAQLQTILGQTIVIENKPGANSIIGVETVAKAPPDGYTLLTVITAHAANASLYEERMSAPSTRDLIPISLVGVSPLIMTASKAFAPNTVGELITYARANPGKVSFASSGVGSAAHLTSELLAHTANIQMVHIPYKGTAPAVTDLIAGNVQILVDVPSSMMQHVDSGKVKALGMFASKRLPAAPNVPTLPESGGPPIESASWVMFLAPAGTPPDIVKKLSDAVAQAVRSPELSARFAELAIIAVGNTPAEARKYLDDEIAKWKQVIKTANVKAE
jgi:tripartite-type tricarboxylate transporter receptor subunit TctC